MERFADPVIHDERRYQASLEAGERLAIAADDYADALMQPDERYYPYAVGNMMDALNDVSMDALEKIAAALESGDEAMAGMVLGCWLRAYVKPLALALAMDKIDLGDQ